MLNAVLYSVGIVAAFLLGVVVTVLMYGRRTERTIRKLERVTAEMEQIFQGKAVLN
jgi:hypothetical protein